MLPKLARPSKAGSPSQKTFAAPEPAKVGDGSSIGDMPPNTAVHSKTSISRCTVLNTVHEPNGSPDDIANCGHRHGVATALDYLPLSQALWEASWVDALDETPLCRVEASHNC